MEKDSKIKIVNIMSGSNYGGAENFFERFSIALNKESNILQKVIIRKNKRRYNLLKKNGIDIEELAFKGKWDLLTKKSLKKKCEIFQPDVILTWMNRASYLISDLDKSIIKIGRLGGYYNIKNYIYCDYLIANTEDIKDFIISKGWDPEKVFCLNNFVGNDLEYVKHKTKNVNEKILLGLGRFHENKAFETIISALPKLKNFELILVGTGKLKKYYQLESERLGVSHKVKIINWVEDVSKYYLSADYLICPSRIEPLGNIIIEAWSYKLPVVASNIMGPKRLIKHKINGMKFEVEDVDGLISCLNEINSNKTLKNKIIENAYNDYQKKFSKDVVIKKFKEILKRLKK
ncbi:MAG: hypothetical protein CMP25_00220 [Rickettsiales bacterium]|nr:hypothetical protein [Rickettsiales bacterium]